MEQFKNLESDRGDTNFEELLDKLPEELAEVHEKIIEEGGYTNKEAYSYLKEILNKREQVLTETEISDTSLKEKIKNNSEEIFEKIDTEVFTDKENFLGSGRTAKVKYFAVEDPETDERVEMAVKYLITPTEKTLSASEEHDMLIEVERMQHIEEIEEEAHLHFIKVPHPYFHHQTENIQCYGMELIDGFDLSYELNNMRNGEDKDKLIEKLAQINLEELKNEIKTFFALMHTYCLHGDVKPANIMVDKEGLFYLIDFGQSVLNSDIPDKAQDQLYTLRDDEITIAYECIRKLVSDAKNLVAT